MDGGNGLAGIAALRQGASEDDISMPHTFNACVHDPLCARAAPSPPPHIAAHPMHTRTAAYTAVYRAAALHGLPPALWAFGDRAGDTGLTRCPVCAHHAPTTCPVRRASRRGTVSHPTAATRRPQSCPSPSRASHGPGTTL